MHRDDPRDDPGQELPRTNKPLFGPERPRVTPVLLSSALLALIVVIFVVISTVR